MNTKTVSVLLVLAVLGIGIATFTSWGTMSAPLPAVVPSTEISTSSSEKMENPLPKTAPTPPAPTAPAPTIVPPSAPQKPAPQKSSVTIKDYTFLPGTLTVKRGTTVTWTNTDLARHTITADSGVGPSSEFFGQGERYSYTFATAGSYPYHCEPHPYMTGTVIVTE